MNGEVSTETAKTGGAGWKSDREEELCGQGSEGAREVSVEESSPLAPLALQETFPAFGPLGSASVGEPFTTPSSSAHDGGIT